MDVTIGRDMYGTIYYESSSPYMRLMDQYDRWRAQLTEQYDLPGSTGLTEENSLFRLVLLHAYFLNPSSN